MLQRLEQLTTYVTFLPICIGFRYDFVDSDVYGSPRKLLQ